MRHEESTLQQQCVAWFRAQYPQYAMLLTHPINEGWRGTGVVGGIHKAEGTVKGVPDLLFFLPVLKVNLGFSLEDRRQMGVICGLGIEFKTDKGKQSQEQKDFEKMFVAAGYAYEVVRSFEKFKFIITNWIAWADPSITKQITDAHREIAKEQLQRERDKLKKIVGRKAV